MSSTNGLTEAQEERLAMLAEEASEIVKACTKILRHGYQSTNPYKPREGTNEDMLNTEINQMLAIRCRMYELGDLKSQIPNFTQIWRDKLPYTHHQRLNK